MIRVKNYILEKIITLYYSYCLQKYKILFNKTNTLLLPVTENCNTITIQLLFYPTSQVSQFVNYLYTHHAI